MKTTVTLLALGVGLGAASLLADPSPTAQSGSVAQEATAGIQYNPAASAKKPAASPVAVPTPAAGSSEVTSLPTVNVREQDTTKKKVDHDVAVTNWLKTPPALLKKQLGPSMTFALLAPPKEGANHKAEEPLVDLEW